MDEESLADWAARRERRRADRYRVDTLSPGPRQGDHVNPDAPRLISRWNGYEWEAVALAANLAEAKRFTHPQTAGTHLPDPGSLGGAPSAGPLSGPGGLGGAPSAGSPGTSRGTGRHRRPSVGDAEDRGPSPAT